MGRFPGGNKTLVSQACEIANPALSTCLPLLRLLSTPTVCRCASIATISYLLKYVFVCIGEQWHRTIKGVRYKIKYMLFSEDDSNGAIPKKCKPGTRALYKREVRGPRSHCSWDACTGAFIAVRQATKKTPNTLLPPVPFCFRSIFFSLVFGLKKCLLLTRTAR